MPALNPIVVIGGGAAGFFGAIKLAEERPDRKVILLEKNRQLLSKVRVSGGGRCNVTHACFDPMQLIKNYPRGNKELRGPFSKFQPADTVAWFEKRGVALKTEADGRMFPVTDSSETIIYCLMNAAKQAGVQILTENALEEIVKEAEHWKLKLSTGTLIEAEAVLFASGSSLKVFESIRSLGHSIVPAVPSLFTFNVPTSPLLKLSGVSVADAEVSFPAFKLKQRGPLLLTHFGFSGPAALKLSAFSARELFNCGYKTELIVDLLPAYSVEECKNHLEGCKTTYAGRQISNECPFALPKTLWKAILEKIGLESTLKYSHLSKAITVKLVEELKTGRYKLEGKTTNKEEFVTAGGVELSEVDFRTMESRIAKGIYFAGEVLNIDGVTGGFNFQNAWTTSWIAASSISKTN